MLFIKILYKNGLNFFALIKRTKRSLFYFFTLLYTFPILMKNFVDFSNNSVFPISVSIATLIKNRLPFQMDSQDKNQTLILEDSSRAFFQVVPTTSSSHFYVKVLNKKYRVCKKFYDYLNSQSNSDKTKATKSLDKFYTKPAAAQMCVDTFLNSVQVSSNDLIVEPSAGNGSFILPLERVNCTKKFIDISPEDNRVEQADFLT